MTLEERVATLEAQIATLMEEPPATVVCPNPECKDQNHIVQAQRKTYWHCAICGEEWKK